MKKKICIVISIYNEIITRKMLKKSLEELKKNKIFNVKVIEVPGSFEIPVIISKVIKKYDGFIAIGCTIKGETANFDLICNSITNGIMQLSIANKKPIGNGIITSFNKKQAFERLNNGREAAKAVIDILKIS